MSVREDREAVKRRVEWWLDDAAFRPPEVLGEHYYRCMAEDIADVAMGGLDFWWSSQRLDPPTRERPDESVAGPGGEQAGA